jgi:uncharacterized membrane protein
MTLFTPNLNKTKQFLLFGIFSFSLIVSHYAIAEIFLAFILIAYFVSMITKKMSLNISWRMILLFSVLMFFWYIYTSGSATFSSFIDFGGNLVNQLSDFMDPSSRGEVVLMGLGVADSPTFWNTVSRIFAYATELFIMLGFVGILLKRVKYKFSKEYFVMCLFAVIFILALIIVPGLANTLRMERFYHILLFFLAPFFAIGLEFSIKSLYKRKTETATLLVICIILVPYFLFQTGFVYNVTQTTNYSVSLGSHQMDDITLYNQFAYQNDWKVSGAEWLKDNVKSDVTIYADSTAHELIFYGMWPHSESLTNTTYIAPESMIYFSYVNVKDNTIITSGYSFDSNQLSYISDMSTLYSNGGCEIFT